ncbi:hypothetical protein [Enterococcus columbae]|uniref:Uncharacterized protein n=1 Tax=Enterococcus columbae DSM 7374 = ATCC 51263 TaxID=1121865 RepID=S1NJ58_9ENTE|nr:hypothetical protein [Enterococcus columbae]EOT40450.1 hypothetical protein OMW_01312 [Enterococcus columbae DSM 7374 = ATCC 51263]EOW80226.1 hypothetical protein I568_01926 [Enterococcus columbae DSM 7374 = ATCC 51263]OJG25613.1 hypothetical protein RR47_GL001662 [Enterococcus columbae DSM 7374 = ATCC 51263]
MATQRKTNFEALRCICAVMIVAGHITGETDISRGGAHRLFLALMSSGARIAVSTSNLVKAALLFCGHVLWFPCVYTGMLICSPFLNQIICLCTKRWLQYILLVNLFLLSFIPTIVPGNSGCFLMNLIGSYLYTYLLDIIKDMESILWRKK